MFLTRKQLRKMTGFSTPKKQREWLAENGYSFDVRADGKPNVLHQQVVERQCKQTRQTLRSEPNIEAMNSFQ